MHQLLLEHGVTHGRRAPERAEATTKVFKAHGLGGGSTTNIDAKLEGVSDEAMQAVTDRAYQDTVAALTKAGFEVVPADELQAQPLYKELMAKV